MAVEQSCQGLLNNRASHCWSIVPVTVEQSCQWLLNNHNSHCWSIVPVTVEESCQWLLKNHASHCWITLSVTVKQSCQWLLKNYASDCWRIVAATVDQSCQWLFNNRAKSCHVPGIRHIIPGNPLPCHMLWHLLWSPRVSNPKKKQGKFWSKFNFKLKFKQIRIYTQNQIYKSKSNFTFHSTIKFTVRFGWPRSAIRARAWSIVLKLR